MKVTDAMVDRAIETLKERKWLPIPGWTTSETFNGMRAALETALNPCPFKPGDWIVGIEGSEYYKGETVLVVCVGPSYNVSNIGVPDGYIGVIRPRGGNVMGERRFSEFRHATQEEINKARDAT